MTHETDLKRLLKAKARLEQRIQDLDRKIEHVLFRLNEDRRCFSRKCPLDLDEDAEDRPDQY